MGVRVPVSPVAGHPYFCRATADVCASFGGGFRSDVAAGLPAAGRMKVEE